MYVQTRWWKKQLQQNTIIATLKIGGLWECQTKIEIKFVPSFVCVYYNTRYYRSQIGS